MCHSSLTEGRSKVYSLANPSAPSATPRWIPSCTGLHPFCDLELLRAPRPPPSPPRSAAYTGTAQGTALPDPGRGHKHKESSENMEIMSVQSSAELGQGRFLAGDLGGCMTRTMEALSVQWVIPGQLAQTACPCMSAHVGEEGGSRTMQLAFPSLLSATRWPSIILES